MTTGGMPVRRMSLGPHVKQYVGSCLDCPNRILDLFNPDTVRAPDVAYHKPRTLDEIGR